MIDEPVLRLTFSRDMNRVEELDRRFYPDYVDEHVRFDGLIRRYLQPNANVLDAGAGHGAKYRFNYRGVVDRMVGVDVDPAVLDNPNLTHAVVSDLADLPFAEDEF